MFPYRWSTSRGCAAAVKAVARIEAALRSVRTPIQAARIGHLCEFIERGVGPGAGVAEKLVLIYAQARQIERADGTPSDVERARQVSLSSCSSLRAIIDRLSVQ